MDSNIILYPVFALVFLTFAITLWMGKLRFSAVKRGDLNPKYYELNRGGKVPEYLAKVSQNYDNLLELPILFYVLCALLYITNQIDITLVVLAWAFVSSRYLHSFIHTTSNNVRKRMLVFISGGLILIAMWAIFLVKVI